MLGLETERVTLDGVGGKNLPDLLFTIPIVDEVSFRVAFYHPKKQLPERWRRFLLHEADFSFSPNKSPYLISQSARYVYVSK